MPAADLPASRARFQTVLVRLEAAFPETPSLLAYRSPFELMVAVILSAQTTDEQVNGVLPELFARFPSPAALAAAEIATVERIVHPVGFFRVKARNIVAAARSLVDRFDGVVPRDMEALLKIPGVGRKSAGVLRTHLYEEPSIIVDTHFARVTRRLGFSEHSDPAKLERDVAEILPETEWNAASMRLNYHGRRTCTARAPECARCPLLDLCPTGKESGA